MFVLIKTSCNFFPTEIVEDGIKMNRLWWSVGVFQVFVIIFKCRGIF
jgi:hypothetical protein